MSIHIYLYNKQGDIFYLSIHNRIAFQQSGLLTGLVSLTYVTFGDLFKKVLKSPMKAIISQVVIIMIFNHFLFKN